jgi:TonB family protein
LGIRIGLFYNKLRVASQAKSIDRIDKQSEIQSAKLLGAQMKVIRQLSVNFTFLLFFALITYGEEAEPTLPDEINNLTSEQVFNPTPKIETIYPLRAKKDGVNADVWLKYKLINLKPDSIEVVFCSKGGYDLEKAAVMSLRGHDFSRDSRSSELKNQWLYSIVKFGFGVFHDSDKTNARHLPEDSPAATGCSGKIIMPELIYKSRPEYPLKARQKFVEANVTVRILVDEKGIPIDAQISKSTEIANAFGFNNAVLKSAKECRFKPMLCDGEPRDCWVSLPYEFRLSK